MKPLSSPSLTGPALALTLAVGALVLAALLFPKGTVSDVPVLRVAFVGNSITFVNDLPRFLQALSGDTMIQNSCLHGALSFLTMLKKGNGMLSKWTTPNALEEEKYYGNDIYDYGACSFPQLLFGHDSYLSQGNQNGYYVNDGKNPCFESYYLNFLNQAYARHGTPQWDFVVMNDQTLFPAIYSKRQKSLLSLKSTYASMMVESGARPVLMATHGYKARAINTTAQGNVAEFTSRVHYGYQQYAQALAERLPNPNQQPLVAPVGLAFLVVHEQARGFWKRLFFIDGLHPSPHGTYLMGCVLYATLYQRMPRTDVALKVTTTTTATGHADLCHLWNRARKMQIGAGPVMKFPTADEAAYLWRVAQRVVLQGYIPKSLLTADQVEVLEEADVQAYNNKNNDDDENDDDG